MHILITIDDVIIIGIIHDIVVNVGVTANNTVYVQAE
jgi:hypothetical protein